MEQLPLGDEPRRLFTCTPTRLTTWLDCPRRYRHTYLDRPPPPKGPPWAHLSLGTSVHLGLRTWWSLPVAQRTPEAAARAVHEQWQADGFRDDAQSSDYRQRAGDWAATYVEHLDATDEPLGVERTVAMKTDRLAFSGRIDRVDDRVVEGQREAVVVDYKTGRQPSTVDEARSSLALALYAASVARTLRRTCVQVELHHIPTGTTATWRHDEHTLSRHLRRTTEIADEAQEAEARFGTADEGVAFPAHPGPSCTWCDFRASCPEGRAVSDRADSWAALPA
jgi:hypothetical protein